MIETTSPLHPYRRHTYYFSRRTSTDSASVCLQREFDMSAVVAHRATYGDKPNKPSYTSYLIWAISQILLQYPQANSCIVGKIRPKIAQFKNIDVKVALDKRGFGTRAILARVIEDSPHKSPEEIQVILNDSKKETYEESPLFAPVRTLNRLPTFLGHFIYNKLMNIPAKRHGIHGSFTISSLGQGDLDAFYPLSSNTLTFGVATLRQRPVVRNGDIVIRPILPMSMVFDHRVLDGALAGDILKEISKKIENI